MRGGASGMVRDPDVVAGGGAAGLNCAVATLQWGVSPCLLLYADGERRPGKSVVEG
jgi:succinate dehydrogenase/fumarate reductase flavoprotein subunit